MENLSVLTSLLFIVTTLLTIYLFYQAANQSKPVLIIMLCWLLFQTILPIAGFYVNAEGVPPRLLLPPILFILLVFFSSRGRQNLNQLDTGRLTLLHVVRVPVELVLYGLFLQKQVPLLMTFAGGNFDILSGITAPVVFYYLFIKKRLNHKMLLAWNFICLGLLLFIVFRAVLSVPTPFQKLAFDQPNVAVLHFPYVWLPSIIVPLVLISHLEVIRRLIFKSGTQKRLSI